MSVAPPTLDLLSCSTEPVHIPGAIQPHGLLLVLDPDTLAITGASDNAERFLGIRPADLVGRTIAAVARIRDPGALAGALVRRDLEARNPLALALDGAGSFDAIAHRHDGRLILECEPADREVELEQTYFYNRVRGSLVRLRGAATLGELCDQTAREVRALTGFDRVIVYAFRPDLTGEVVAEAADEPRYLGLRFPASDIPSQARALYAVCRLRMIPTSTYRPAALVGRAGDRPVDLTHATLRSVSPVHLEYMRNMGVTASLGISLMRDHQLWGLITCNHESGPRMIPYPARMACALIGEVVSSLIVQRQQVEASEKRLGKLSTQARLLQLVAQDRDLVSGLTQHTPSLQDVANAGGAVLAFDDELHCIGHTPPAEELRALLAWIAQQPEPTLAFDSLPAHYPAAHAWRDVGCGMIAARISFRDSVVVSRPAWLLWFRPELAQTVVWGGDPHKAPAIDPYDRLRPRTSFAQWRESVHLQSAPFEPEEIAAVASLVEALGDVILEITATRKIKETAILLADANRQLMLQIEETKRAELELRRAQKLEAAGRLAAGIAHEINTPLQFVGDSVRFVKDASEELISLVPAELPASSDVDVDYLKANLPVAIARSLDGLDRVARIVSAMKEFAHAEGPDKSPADINHALAMTVEIARAELKNTATVAFELADLPKIPCFIGDLGQLFLNLIVNAAHAIADTLGATRARGTISIKSWQDDASVFVSITDDGAGIPEAVREHIFTPFFTTKELGRGTGQGLAICHAIAAKHDGSITFQTEVGRGTTFTLQLPLSDDAPPASPR